MSAGKPVLRASCSTSARTIALKDVGESGLAGCGDTAVDGEACCGFASDAAAVGPDASGATASFSACANEPGIIAAARRRNSQADRFARAPDPIWRRPGFN